VVVAGMEAAQTLKVMVEKALKENVDPENCVVQLSSVIN
jgi:hypothetical protein